MEAGRVGQRALGAYFAPWYALIVPVLFGAIQLVVGLIGRHANWWQISSGILVLAAAGIPTTIVRASGLLLPLRFTRLPWGQVAAIREIDIRSRESLSVRCTDDRVLVLTGVPADRLLGLMELARAGR